MKELRIVDFWVFLAGEALYMIRSTDQHNIQFSWRSKRVYEEGAIDDMMSNAVEVKRAWHKEELR